MIPKTAAEILASAKYEPPKKHHKRHNRNPGSFSSNPSPFFEGTAQPSRVQTVEEEALDVPDIFCSAFCVSESILVRIKKK